MPFDYNLPATDYGLDIDYAAQDEQIRETRQWLRDELPWVAATEMEKLTDQEDFPGFLADCNRLASFVAKMKRGKVRYVACKVQQRSFTVSARVDLVSGLVYLSDAGRNVMTNIDGDLTVEVMVPSTYYPYRGMTKRKFCGVVRNGRLDHMSPTEMNQMVDALSKAERLAAL